jgi:hypothetical protein
MRGSTTWPIVTDPSRFARWGGPWTGGGSRSSLARAADLEWAHRVVNNLIKRVKRSAFGFTSFRNYRIRSLLYAGKLNWDLLATVRSH